MSIAAELIREWQERQRPAPVVPLKRRRRCMGEDARRNPCRRPPVVQGRICAECWKAMQRRTR